MKKLLFISICFALSINLSQSQDLTTDLLLHYSFDGDFNDLSPNGYTGVGNATFAPDRHGNPI